MTDIIINIESINPIELVGINNNKFDLLKKQFPNLKILSRGTQIKLSGKTEEVDLLAHKINQIIEYIERNGTISVEFYAKLLQANNATELLIDELPNNVLVFGPNGRVIRAKTENQKLLVETSNNNDITFAIGPAGTGKTYTAVAIAVRALKNKIVRKIILTRPAVEAGENLGFLPGDLKEKIDPYLRPLYDALEDMIPLDKLNYFMTNRIIEVAPLAYMRGRTLDNSFIILDEAQNTTDLQLKMFLTRIGPSAKAIITGDMTQVDLPRNTQSGLAKAERILSKINGIGFIKLNENDVVRHKLVKQIIRAYEEDQIRLDENNIAINKKTKN